MQKIPSISELLSSPMLKPWLERLSPGTVVSTARGVMEDIRSEVFSAAHEKRMPDVSDLAQKIISKLHDIPPGGDIDFYPTVNGTGIVFHDVFGGPPMAPEALEPVFCLAGRGGAPRAQANTKTVELLKKLTGAEDALIFSGFAAAKMIALSSFAFGKEVIVSRADLYDTDDGYRLTDLLRLTGARLKEVGSVNRTSTDDYIGAIGENTGLLYISSGIGTGCEFSLEKTEPASLKKLVENLKHRVPLALEVEFGSLCDLKRFGLGGFPSIPELVSLGSDLILFRSCGLIGGPDCGILVGRKSHLDKIRESTFTHAFSPLQMFSAALEATLKVYIKEEDWAIQSIPVIQLISISMENLRNRGNRLLSQIQASELVESATLEESRTIFHKDCPNITMPGYRISIKPKDRSLSDFVEFLLEATPALALGVQDDKAFLDLRTVPPKFDPAIADIFNPEE